MTTVVWQTQLAKRFMSKGFLLLLVLRSSFSPPPGTRTLWYVSPLQRSISSLPRDSTGGIYKALTCWRMLNIPTLHKDIFPVSSIGKTLTNQPQVSAAGDTLCLPQDKVSPDDFLHIFPNVEKQPLAISWNPPPSDAPGTGHDHQLDGLAISHLPGGSWAELIQLKVTANSPCLALLSPHSLVEQLIVFNCHYSEYQWS